MQVVRERLLTEFHLIVQLHCCIFPRALQTQRIGSQDLIPISHRSSPAPCSRRPTMYHISPFISTHQLSTHQSIKASIHASIKFPFSSTPTRRSETSLHYGLPSKSRQMVSQARIPPLNTCIHTSLPHPLLLRRLSHVLVGFGW